MNEGKFEGQQLLSQQRVREALGRTSWSGYLTHGDWRGTHYRHGFWSTVVETPACKIPVTYMLGFGGNYVIFLPNDGVIFRFMDEFDFEFKDLVRRVEKVIPVCRDA